MTKAERDYEKLYGSIPEELTDRMHLLMEQVPDRYLSQLETDLSRIERMTWKEYQFTIYLLPKATPRPRYSGRTNKFYVRGASEAKQLFTKIVKEKQAKNEEVPYIQTVTTFLCRAYLPTPSSMSKVETVLSELGYIRPTSIPDWDNLGKTYSDMIQGILLSNDSLIVDGQVQKFYSMKPRIEVILRWQEGFDSKFNERKFKDKL